VYSISYLIVVSVGLSGCLFNRSITNMSKPQQKVINPYAKKKSVVPSTSSSPTSTSAGGNNTNTNSSLSNNNKKVAGSSSNGISNNPYLTKKPKQPPRKQTTPSPPKTKKIKPVDEFTTFSQAFGSPNKDYEADYFNEEERAQQLEFDKSLEVKKSPFASSSHKESNTSSSNSNAYIDNGITARDHHTLLQDNVLHISTRQRGNPIISHIRNVPFQYSTMVPDYILAPTRCALYLSIRYHNLHPQYIHRRIAELKSDFTYRMLLCLVDICDNANAILFLNDLCCQNNLTLILCWSEEEAARYLETVKVFNNKDPSSIIGKKEIAGDQFLAQTAYALKAAASVNQTDASQLLTQFGSWKNMTQASIEELSVCPGIGVKKVRRLHEAFHRPFSREFSKRRKQREEEKKKKKGNEEEKKASD